MKTKLFRRLSIPHHPTHDSNTHTQNNNMKSHDKYFISLGIFWFVYDFYSFCHFNFASRFLTVTIRNEKKINKKD